MGTATYYSGALAIEPPLTWPEIQQSEAWPGHPEHEVLTGGYGRLGARININEDTVETSEGTLIRRSGHRVEIVGDDLRHDGVMDDLRKLARLFGTTHNFVGTLLCHDDYPESLPFWVRIVGTEAVEVHPVLLWPGDEKAETIVATTLGHAVGGEVGECVNLAKRILYDLTDLNRKK